MLELLWMCSDSANNTEYSEYSRVHLRWFWLRQILYFLNTRAWDSCRDHMPTIVWCKECETCDKTLRDKHRNTEKQPNGILTTDTIKL